MAYSTIIPIICGMNIVPIEARLIALSHGLADGLLESVEEGKPRSLIKPTILGHGCKCFDETTGKIFWST